MLSLLARLPASVDTTVPPTTVASGDGGSDSSIASSVADVVSAVWDNVLDNGYQTGAALVVATAAVVLMVNLKVPKYVILPVAIGAFWGGWLAWNTITLDDQPLFPGDVEATKLWDIAFADDRGFLVVTIVACVAAVFLWRTSIQLVSRVALLAGAILGASFFYNLFEALRTV